MRTSSTRPTTSSKKLLSSLLALPILAAMGMPRVAQARTIDGALIKEIAVYNESWVNASGKGIYQGGLLVTFDKVATGTAVAGVSQNDIMVLFPKTEADRIMVSVMMSAYLAKEKVTATGTGAAPKNPLNSLQTYAEGLSAITIYRP